MLGIVHNFMPPESDNLFCDSRLQALQNWLTSCLPDSTFQITPIRNDASFRRYFRLHTGKQTLIAMDAPVDKIQLQPFLDIAHHLRQLKLNVPDIYHYALPSGFVLMRDLGTCAYSSALTTDTADFLYHEALQALFILQTRAKTQNLPNYDTAFVMFELSLFKDWFLGKHLSIELTPADEFILQTTFELLINNTLEQPKVFMHRDYHCRNIMVCNENNPGILDFQDAVLGPITYDLVSLLRDCYISWPADRVFMWMENYYLQLKTANIIHTDLNHFHRWFDLMGLQRHLKIMGIFSRLYHRDNKPGYLNDIPLAFRYVKQVCSAYKPLHAFLGLLQKLDIENRINNRPS